MVVVFGNVIISSSFFSFVLEVINVVSSVVDAFNVIQLRISDFSFRWLEFKYF